MKEKQGEHPRRCIWPMLPVVLIIMRLVKDDGEAIDHHKKGTRATGTFWSRAPSSPAGLAVA